ncbi:hypothetical protein MLD38_028292 [Melastoma candidum]|uniref:Uncharacterized protein n=1 Tax=Melastoma candidum TaxID=119954 RepID=A0ACB9N1X9_9MYRT|nr:hypothetical protein MLD38_028292 [Melastoma candidum]
MVMEVVVKIGTMAFCGFSSKMALFLILGVMAMMNVKGASGELERLEHPTKADGSLGFLVLGDWGRRGDYNQSEVASQMGRIGEELDIDFVVSTGDNFYDDGLTGEHDPNFEESFSKIYTAKSLQKPWYTVLGNHDYRGDVEAQLSPVLRKIDSRWICLRSFIVNAELVEIFFVDTTPFVGAYFANFEDHTYDWRGIKTRRSYLRSLLKDVDSALRASPAKWKIVVGHHAVRSISHHGDTPELIKFLLPILRTNDVDFYINGHDHCLQQITDTESRIQFLTSGAGSKAWRGDINGIDRQDVKFFHDGQGFLSVELTETDARIAFYDVFGKVMHTWNAAKQPISDI